MESQRPVEARVDRAALMEFRRRNQNGLYAVAVEMSNRAKLLATRHTDNGTRRNSITQAKTSDGRQVLWGIPIKSAPHAPHLEFGFRPHWVPGRYIGLWMQRNGVGVGFQRMNRSAGERRWTRSKPLKRIQTVQLGLYVGGPGSRLQHAPGGTRGRLFGKGGKLVTQFWMTRGGSSPWLRPHKVGHPILQPVARQAVTIPTTVFARGFARG